MKKFLLLSLALVLTACLEIENSSSSDSGGLTFDPDATPEFLAANAVFLKSCSTLGCHSQNFGSLTEDEFISSGRVIPGSPTSSTIYCRNTGSSGACTTPGNKSMPNAGAPLTVQELQIIEDWITAITP